MNKFNTIVESHEVKSSKESGVQVNGLALPFEKVSRNGFTYIKESIENAYKSLEGAPVLFNHNTENVIGHVEVTGLDGQGMTYEMDLDPEDVIARKVARGDLTKVSIQCSYDENKSYIDDEGVTHAYINEFYELSVVSIPGFADTTAQVREKLKESHTQTLEKEDGKNTMSEEEQPKEEMPVEEPQTTETPETSESEEQVEQTTTEEESDVIKRVAVLEKQMAAMTAKLEEASEPEKDDEQEEAEDEETPEEEDEEKKREEAINNDKVITTAESVSQKPVKLSREELIETVKELI